MSTAFPTHTPVQLSPDLIHAIDSSVDSAVSRQQRAIQKQNLAQASALGEQLTNAKNLLHDTIANATADPSSNAMKGTAELNQKLDSVYQILKESAEAKISKSPELLQAETKVKECLIANKGKPLNCWDLVKEFKHIAGNP